MPHRGLVALTVASVCWIIGAALVLSALNQDTSVNKPIIRYISSISATQVPTIRPTHTPTSTPTMTPRPTSTPLPNCHVAMFDGVVCAWPTSTPVSPLPECGTPDAGQACIRRLVVVTMVGLTPTIDLP